MPNTFATKTRNQFYDRLPNQIKRIRLLICIIEGYNCRKFHTRSRARFRDTLQASGDKDGICHCLIGSFRGLRFGKVWTLETKAYQLPRLHHCCRTWQPLATLSLHDYLSPCFSPCPITMTYNDSAYAIHPPHYSTQAGSQPEECLDPNPYSNLWKWKIRFRLHKQCHCR